MGALFLEPATIALLDVAAFNLEREQPSFGCCDHEITLAEDPAVFHDPERVARHTSSPAGRILGISIPQFQHGTPSSGEARAGAIPAPVS